MRQAVSRKISDLFPTPVSLLSRANPLTLLHVGGISSAYPSEIPSTPFNQLWQFTPSAGGISGQWVQVFPSTASTFETLQRTVDAAYGFGGAVGYAVGGYSGSYAVPGMVEFNTSSQEWSNSSILAISKSNSATSGMAQWVPTFGPEGLLFLLGGEAANSPFTLTIMWMYDPSTKTWRSQTTTGDVPSVMDKGCVVGAEGDDGTYEVRRELLHVAGFSITDFTIRQIFLYGQANYWYAATDSSIADSVVYVLSLPSFHWTKQDAVATVARNRHTCNVIGGRQMVIVGGVVGIVGQLFTADPWDNGIGIFDMSAFEWTDSYNPNALPYVTPQVVKDYAKTHPHPSAWADSTVEAWFTKASKYIYPLHVTATGLTAIAQTPSPPNGSSNTGAIAGGVVGGVAALAILAGVIFFVRRKRRRTRPPERPIELESKGEASELEARLNAQPKAVDDEGVKELDSDDRYELEGGWHGNESGVK